jgi:hypothetical protein
MVDTAGAPAPQRVRVPPGFWARVVVLVATRPWLWAVALRQLTRLARPGWWRRAPFLPVPDAGYLAFRWSTAYGAGASPRPTDVLAYLHWCRGRER